MDPASVQILGVLPAVALPDSGFLLSPVLAWSPRPMFTGSANLAEVSALATISLRQLAHPETGSWPVGAGNHATDGATMDARLGNIGAVTRVVIDLVTGMISRSAASHPTTAIVELERALT